MASQNIKTKRVLQTGLVEDPASVDAIVYSRQTAAFKSSHVGTNLIPIYTGSSYTTDASSGIILPKQGCLLAVYNKDTSVHSIAMALNAANLPSALAAGVTNSNGSVGIPVAPSTWLLVAAFTNTYILTDNNNLLVYLINDDSAINVING
jgi:hypothetical protein